MAKTEENPRSTCFQPITYSTELPKPETPKFRATESITIAAYSMHGKFSETQRANNSNNCDLFFQSSSGCQQSPPPPPSSSTLSTSTTRTTTTETASSTITSATMAETRTPMAWQHRDMNYQTQRGDVSPSRRFTPTPNSRYGGPPTPNSAHSRHSRTPDHRRNERGSSSDR